MFRDIFRFTAIAAVVALSSFCMAQSAPEVSPWTGSWKLSPSSLHFEGGVYTMAVDADGYTMSVEGKQMAKVVCQGKPVSNPNGTVATCVALAKGFKTDNTRDGKPVSVVTWNLLPGGMKATRTVYQTPEGEAPYTMTQSYDRVGSGSKMGGDWKVVGFTETQDTGILGIEVTGDSVAFRETDSPKAIVCKLDGTPTAAQGTNMMSVKLIDPRTLKVNYMSGDRVMRENTFALSLDGKTISETDFTSMPTATSEMQLFHKM